MSIESDFVDIVEWCAIQAPVTAAALADRSPDKLLTDAVDATGGKWPADLMELYRQANGSSGQRANLFEGFYFLTVDELVSRWASMSERWESEEGLNDSIRQAVADEGEPDLAGHPNAYWSRSFLPFAQDGDGGYLFVDVRPGPNTGCVRQWDRLERDSPARWESIGALIQDVAATLVRGEDALDQSPVVVEGLLRWVD